LFYIKNKTKQRKYNQKQKEDRKYIGSGLNQKRKKLKAKEKNKKTQGKAHTARTHTHTHTHTVVRSIAVDVDRCFTSIELSAGWLVSSGRPPPLPAAGPVPVPWPETVRAPPVRAGGSTDLFGRLLLLPGPDAVDP
jgi:hypothetical protein